MSDFNAKMHQIRFPSICIAFADPLAVFKGPTFKGKEGKVNGREKGRGGKGNGGPPIYISGYATEKWPVQSENRDGVPGFYVFTDLI